MSATARVTDTKLVLPLSVTEPVVVSFDDHYVWSFLPPRDGLRHPTGWHVPWPESLQHLLSGSTRVRLADSTGQQVHLDAGVAFAGSSDPLVLRDADGHRLAVDRAGHLSRVFAETDATLRRFVAEGTARALRDLREHAGVDAHLSYGALLGAVRDGRMIGHDTDTDLAYLSRHTHPADVARESFCIERAMRERGWRVERMSGADLKLFLPLEDGRVVHVDVFAAFHVEGVFHQLGGRSGSLGAEALTPAGTVVLEGVPMPGPADPERVLEFLYGAGWRVPDPSFQNRDPGDGVRRIEGWFRGNRRAMSEWNELYRTRVNDVPGPGSSFARWTAERVPADGLVVDVACGTGRDAVWFARHGHPVVACDYARRALRITRRRLRRRGVAEPDVRHLVLGDLRSVLSLGADLARLPEPPVLHARDLLGCLDRESRDNLWLLASMALRRGGALHLEFAATRPGRWSPRVEHLVRRCNPESIRREITRAGGHVTHVERGPGEDFLGRDTPDVVRLVARWDTTPAPPTRGGSMLEDRVNEAPTTRARRLARRAMSVPARLLELESAVQQNRRLNRRIAELTDVVVELLVPIADRDEEKVQEVLDRYRSTSLAP